VAQRPSEAFQKTLWEVQKRWGDQALITARQLSTVQSFPTGLAALDHVLSLNGIPAGHLTEVIGMPTSGMTTLLCMAVAHTQRSGTPTVYIDMSKTFDPYYVSHCGVDLEKLLLVQPKTAAAAFDIARDVLKITRSVFIVLDAITSLPVPPTLATLLRRLQEPLVTSQAALVVLFPASQIGLLSAFAHTRLRVKRDAWLYQDGDLSGYRVRLTVLKDKGAVGPRQTTIDLFLDPAVDGDLP
jgi:hypothetical protein